MLSAKTLISNKSLELLLFVRSDFLRTSAVEPRLLVSAYSYPASLKTGYKIFPLELRYSFHETSRPTILYLVSVRDFRDTNMGPSEIMLYLQISLTRLRCTEQSSQLTKADTN
jgi:hypothetical protein